MGAAEGLAMEAVALMGLLVVKHFIFDFPLRLQPPWMFLNKGKYGHIGGILHAGIHAIASAVIITTALPRPEELSTRMWMCGAVMFEFLVHYHMDYFKVKIGEGRGWAQRRPDCLAITSHNWFNLLGVDQMVHYLTYVIMVGIWVYSTGLT